MACCIVAALILAQCVAVLRRWGMFWGLVSIPPGEDARSIFSQARAWLGRPHARRMVLAVMLAEVTGVGLWIYYGHGTHLAEVADIGWNRLQGREVVYVGVCGRSGETRTRVVFDHSNSGND